MKLKINAKISKSAREAGPTASPSGGSFIGRSPP
jgi:hypothetical protein